MREAPTIDRYALLGDGRCAALVSDLGAIDWLCLPRFDSPSFFGALLDVERGGTFQVAPAGPFTVERSYLPETNVLETRFHARGGRLRLVDFFAVESNEEKRRILHPEHELVRIAECDAGEVELVIVFDPRPDYGRHRPRIERAGRFGHRFEHGHRLYTLAAEARLEPRAEGGLRGRVHLREGERLVLSLSSDPEGPAVLPALGESAMERLSRTARVWRAFVDRCAYRGDYRDAVVRSLLTVKLLGFAPSGAIVAAPTTSLPEAEGAGYNWDYRYCWIRDASFTMRAYLELGYVDEATAFASWLLHTTRLTRPELRVFYDVYGRVPEPERELEHLAGYHGCRPVRVGNGAFHQFQLDSYGEVIDALARLAPHVERFDRPTQAMLRDFGLFVSEHFRCPDESIWEVRGERRRFTHSAMLAWVALDRLIQLHQRGVLRRLPVERFALDRGTLREAVERRGFSERIRSYTQTLEAGDESVDAALLHLSWYGFHPADHPRMRQTYRCLRSRLGVGPGLFLRNERDRRAHQGAFGLCSFWAAEHLADGGGSLAEAKACFDAAAGRANDVGLLGEEIDPETGHVRGNFPQTFTHVGLISAALALDARAERDARRGAHPKDAASGAAEAAP
jgi:GH15 family glucan-1,4-alpha-glucosidase